MVQGAKWAWWLEAFGLTLDISGCAIGIAMSLLALLVPNAFLRVFSLILISKYVIRLVISSSLLMYFLKENVLNFFRLKRLDTGQALGILFGIAITLMLLLTVVGHFLIRARFAS